MTRLQVRATSLSSLALVAILGCLMAPAFAQLNLVYVESNIASTSNKNSVIAFSNNSGTLTQITGSPFLAGGTGVKATSSATANVFTSEGQIAITSGGAFLYAVNGHSNTIAAFFINSDGTLAPVSGSPFASNGQDPVSVSISNAGPAGNLLVAANEANDPAQTGGTPNFTTFRISPLGALTPVTGSTISKPAGSLASQVLVNPPQKFAFGVLSSKTNSSLTCYSIGVGGKLVQDSVVTPPAPSKTFQGVAANPVYRTVYVGLPDVNEIAVYSYDAACKLTFVRTVNDPGTGVAHLTTNKAATRLYSSSTNSTSVTVWNINVHQQNPTVLQTVTLSPGGAPANLMLDPTEAFLYVLAANLTGVGSPGNFLHVLNVASDGTLLESAPPTRIPITSSEEAQGLGVAMK